MFSSIGWPEIAMIVLLGIVIIGPERLPGVIVDVRAAIYAARKAINNAKAELSGDMGELGKEFESLRAPISQAAEWSRMGPRGVITKALFDGDDSAWDDFNPRNITKDLGKPDLAGKPDSGDAPASPASGGGNAAAGGQKASFDYSQVYADQKRDQGMQPQRRRPGQPESQPRPAAGAKSQAGTGDGRAAGEKPSDGSGGSFGSGAGFSWADVT